jgi:hypothetical protein
MRTPTSRQIEEKSRPPRARSPNNESRTVEFVESVEFVERHVSRFAKVIASETAAGTPPDHDLHLHHSAPRDHRDRDAMTAIHWPTPLVLDARVDDGPAPLVCPITRRLPREPVVLASTGRTFERDAIERWLAHRAVDPVDPTVPASSLELVPNLAARELVEAHARARGALPKQPPPRSAPGKPNSVWRSRASADAALVVAFAGTIIAMAAERLLPRFIRGPSPDELAAARRAAARRVRWPPPLVHPRNLDEDGAPPALVCPITHQLFRQPAVVVATGRTYERDAARRWIIERGTDPVDRDARVRVSELVPNLAVRRAAEAWARRADRVDDAAAASRSSERKGIAAWFWRRRPR